MGKFIRGALIEYGSDFLGPIPNVVIFQFNPETLSRTIQIPGRQVSSQSRETSQAGESPVEQISITAHFNAVDELKDENILAKAFGVGTRLAALEKMVYPTNIIGGLLGQAMDAIGDALGMGGDEEETAVQPIPRKSYPKLLFIWGPMKVLPVVVQSMSINEQLYDKLLNPIKAEVSLSLGVVPPDPCCSDWIAKGASQYTAVVKEAQAIANLANTVGDVVDLIKF